MILPLVSVNLRIPNIFDTEVLDVLSSGLSVLFVQHKTLGLWFTEASVMDLALLTMGDHAAELSGGISGSDDTFNYLYGSASAALKVFLASDWDQLETFAAQVDHIGDIMIFTYPEMVRFCVNEQVIDATRNLGLQLS